MIIIFFINFSSLNKFNYYDELSEAFEERLYNSFRLYVSKIPKPPFLGCFDYMSRTLLDKALLLKFGGFSE